MSELAHDHFKIKMTPPLPGLVVHLTDILHQTKEKVLPNDHEDSGKAKFIKTKSKKKYQRKTKKMSHSPAKLPPSVAWKNNSRYQPAETSRRIVTRSQTAFYRVKDSKSNFALLADKSRYMPPGLPHIMPTMIGTYGAIPSTIITRSRSKYIRLSEEMESKLEPYKRRRMYMWLFDEEEQEEEPRQKKFKKT